MCLIDRFLFCFREFAPETFLGLVHGIHIILGQGVIGRRQIIIRAIGRAFAYHIAFAAFEVRRIGVTRFGFKPGILFGKLHCGIRISRGQGFDLGDPVGVGLIDLFVGGQEVIDLVLRHLHPIHFGMIGDERFFLGRERGAADSLHRIEGGLQTLLRFPRCKPRFSKHSPHESFFIQFDELPAESSDHGYFPQ
ncbi:MAG: hypothetical protein EBX52_11595, partial [Proteobacteria bacterium]|nr:hypothetical protein [Pseudomonadota bacterium]